MGKYSGYSKGLTERFLERESYDPALLMDSVLNYVKNGIGCSQVTGKFYQIGLVENLSFVMQKELAYRIKFFLADEANMSVPKYILSFFIERPEGYVNRATEILDHCDPKAISENGFSSRENQSDSSCSIS